jgi:hypothetical protein
MKDVVVRPGLQTRARAALAAVVVATAAFMPAGHRGTLAKDGAPDACPGVADLLTISPSQEVHLDVFAYVPGALSGRLHRCRNRIGSWFDPVEEGRRQAMGLMFEWAGTFSCAITEYATAPSVLGRPLGGPRSNYLREATRLEALADSYEAEADLRSSEPLQHFRALQLLAKIQSRWNQSTEADQTELLELQARGDPNASIALATLIFTARAGPRDADKALELLAQSARQGGVRAPALGAQYAELAARAVTSGHLQSRYRKLRRQFLVAAAWRGSVEAIGLLKEMLRDSTSADDTAAVAFWDTVHRGITRDLYEIRSACR